MAASSHKSFEDFSSAFKPVAGAASEPSRKPDAGRKKAPGEQNDDSRLFAEAVRGMTGKKSKPAKNQDDEAGLFAEAMRNVAGLGKKPGGAGKNTAAAPRGGRKDADKSGLSANQYKKTAELSGDPVAAEVAATDEDPESALFSGAVSGVKPLNRRGREVPPAIKKSAAAAGGPEAASAALEEFLHGKLEFAVEFTDEFIEGRVVGLDPLVVNKLRAGQYSPEAHLDLHGQNAAQAYDALLLFIRQSYQRGLRTLVIVTGRGRNSPDGVGILRERIQAWLTREPLKRVVLAFCTAQPHDGGAGALYAILRKYKKSHGKVQWDRCPRPEDLLI